MNAELVTPDQEMVMDIKKCSACGNNHAALVWKPVAGMTIVCQGKAITHWAICREKQELILLAKPE